MSRILITVQILDDDQDDDVKPPHDLARIILRPQQDVVGRHKSRFYTATAALPGAELLQWTISRRHIPSHGWVPLVKQAISEMRRKAPECLTSCP